MALPEKDFYRLDEIAARWGATVGDIRYYAEHGLLEVQVWINEKIRHVSKAKERIVIGSKSVCGYVSIDPDEVKLIFCNADGESAGRCPIEPNNLRITRMERDRFEKEHSIKPADEPGGRSFSGRPSTMHKITVQMRERHARGELHPTLNEEARALYEWARKSITDMQIPTTKTIIEGQRSVYRELISKQNTTQT